MSSSKETTKEKAEKPRTIKGALIVEQSLAQRIVAIFDEMPRRYSSIIDPVHAAFTQCPVADVTLNSEPEKETK